jgi:hypothetical protein
LIPPVALSIRNDAVVNATQQLLTLQSLSVGSNSTFAANTLSSLNLTVLGNALVDAGGTMTANAAGYASGFIGQGTGQVDIFGEGSGGGYGGAGGASYFGAGGGLTYGSSNQPSDFGSPGGVFPNVNSFSQGGGAIRLTVNGALTLNGILSANGANGIVDGSGGGAGGSIWVTAQTLSGNGTFTANGGQGESFEGGGGGGGRIAIIASTNSFAGITSVTGGDGASPGQDGTIYIRTGFFISGIVTNLSGTPVPGVLLQPSGLASLTSDTNGFYSVVVPLSWSGSIVPSGNGAFSPTSRTYANLSQDTPNQNFLADSSFTISGSLFIDNYISINWFAVNGANYQAEYSTNFVNWTPYGPIYIGTDTPREVVVPINNAPQMYIRMRKY